MVATGVLDDRVVRGTVDDEHPSRLSTPFREPGQRPMDGQVS
jgi:hypothetical protein